MKTLLSSQWPILNCQICKTWLGLRAAQSGSSHPRERGDIEALGRASGSVNNNDDGHDDSDDGQDDNDDRHDDNDDIYIMMQCVFVCL